MKSNKSKKMAIIDKPVIGPPIIDLRYLIYSNKCIKTVGWSLRDNRYNFEDFFDKFQKFIHDFSNCETISEASKAFSSHVQGSTKSFSETATAKNLMKRLPNEIKAFAKRELTHLHFKRNGKGKETVVGFFDKNIFHVIGLFPEHE